jgi:hypothetical protein
LAQSSQVIQQGRFFHRTATYSLVMACHQDCGISSIQRIRLPSDAPMDVVSELNHRRDENKNVIIAVSRLCLSRVSVQFEIPQGGKAIHPHQIAYHRDADKPRRYHFSDPLW